MNVLSKHILAILFISVLLLACSDKQSPNSQNSKQAPEPSKVEEAQDSKWVAQAKILTTQHKLVSLSNDCLSFEEGEAVNGKKHIEVREEHNEKCGGDPQTAPRLFSFEVDVATGEYKTDRYSIITGGDYESMDKLSRHLLEE